MTTKKTETPTETPTNKRSPIKTASLVLLGIVGVAHIGVLGHLINAVKRPDFPAINFPQGDYSSYKVEATRDGYKIEYKANDPRVLESERSLNLNQKKGGLFGGGTERRSEWRRDEYTMDGARNLGGADGEGKLSAKREECIRADAGARSQGALAGTSIAAGALAPAVINIPYVGWLAAGWMTLLGQRVGSDLGSQVGKVFNDC
jgi:hypothetical protein